MAPLAVSSNPGTAFTVVHVFKQDGDKYIDRVLYLYYLLKVPFSYLHANMTLFIILKQPVTISVTVRITKPLL